MEAYAIHEGNENSKIDCKPFIKWAGGKSQLLSELARRTPSDFGCFYEPFLGGGAFFFSLQPLRSVLVDVNQELISCYTVVRDDVEALIKDLKRHQYDEEYFYRIRNVDRLPDYSAWTALERASRFIFLNKTCYNGLYRVNSRGQYNVPFGRYTNPKIVDPENLRACSRALRNVSLICGSFLSIEDQVTSNDFVYFDPPYAPLNATSNFTSYSKDSFDSSMQLALRDLCERLNSKGIRFMLSNSSAPFVLELYQNFTIEFVDASRAINSSGTKRGKVKEVIITNYRK